MLEIELELNNDKNLDKIAKTFIPVLTKYRVLSIIIFVQEKRTKRNPALNTYMCNTGRRGIKCQRLKLIMVI